MQLRVKGEVCPFVIKSVDREKFERMEAEYMAQQAAKMNGPRLAMQLAGVCILSPFAAYIIVLSFTLVKSRPPAPSKEVVLPQWAKDSLESTRKELDRAYSGLRLMQQFGEDRDRGSYDIHRYTPDQQQQAGADAQAWGLSIEYEYDKDKNLVGYVIKKPIKIKQVYVRGGSV